MSLLERPPWLGPAAAALTGAVMFAAAVAFPLVGDSVEILGRSELLHSPETEVLDLWRHEYWHGVPGALNRGNYRPVTMTTFWLTVRLGLDSAAVHHGLNVALHAIAVLLWGGLLRRAGLGAGLSAAGALWFAVMPVHLEAVVLAVGRAELLMAVLALGALHAHVSASRAEPGSARVLWLGLSLVAGFGAMASKENGVAVAGLIPVVEGLLSSAGRPVPWRGWHRLAVWVLWLVPLGVYLGVRHAALGIWFSSTGVAVVSPLSVLSADQRALFAAAVLAQVWRLALPWARLSADYGFDQVTVPASVAETPVLVGLFGLAVILAVPLMVRPVSRVMLLGAAWFGVSWLPVSHVVFAAGETFAERWLYLPSAGVVLWGVALVTRIPAPGARRAAVLMLAAVMAACTAWHLPPWRSQLTLSRAAAGASPRSHRAMFNWGTDALFAGEYEEAIEAYRRLLANAPPGHPQRAAAENNVAVAQWALGEQRRTGERPALPSPTPLGEFTMTGGI